MSDQEVEVGTGRLLGLFFGLVIACAIFFSVGFLLGRRFVPEVAAAASSTAPAGIGNGGAAKPSPAKTEDASKADCAAGGACPETKSTSDELTFYKAVERNEPRARLEPSSPPVTARTTPRAADLKPPAPESRRPSALGSGYMVQVAAVSKQEDAAALVQALRKKSYPVLAISGPSDKFYHVQVGPYPEMKDAEATRARLIGDGYNPIVKK